MPEAEPNANDSANQNWARTSTDLIRMSVLFHPTCNGTHHPSR
jgi:hypothetical protein